MIHNIVKAEHIPNTYHLKLTFKNGEVRSFNVEPYITDSFVFGPLRNYQTFELFSIKEGTVVWETGADFCPNVLYEKSTPVI